MVERSPEKAGVGGSIPSLATFFSITYSHPKPQFCSILFQKQNLGSLKFVSNLELSGTALAIRFGSPAKRKWVLYASGRLRSVLDNKQEAVW